MEPETIKCHIPPKSLLWNYIKDRGNYSNYLMSLPYMFIPHKPIKAGTISMAYYCGFTCREMLIHCNLRERIRGSKDKGKIADNLFLARVIFFYQSASGKASAGLRNALISGAMLVNIIEREFGWTQTKVLFLSNKKVDPDKNVMGYFEGNGRWFKSPHMASLWFLLLRAGAAFQSKHSQKTLSKKKTLRELLIYINNKSGSMDLNKIKTISNYFPLVLKNYDNLFGKRSILELYSPKSRTSSRGLIDSEGIARLIGDRSVDNELYKTWKKVKQDYINKRSTPKLV